MKQFSFLAALFLLGFTAGLWGQDAKKSAYPQGLIGIHTRFGAASVFSPALEQNYTIPINTILFELIPTKRDKRGSALLLSFRLTQPFTSTPASLNRDMSRDYPFELLNYRPMHHTLTWGFLIGGSTHIYAQDRATGLGWNVLLNGGIFTDISGVINPSPPEFAIFNLGAEMDLKVAHTAPLVWELTWVIPGVSVMSEAETTPLYTGLT